MYIWFTFEDYTYQQILDVGPLASVADDVPTLEQLILFAVFGGYHQRLSEQPCLVSPSVVFV